MLVAAFVILQDGVKVFDSCEALTRCDAIQVVARAVWFARGM